MKENLDILLPDMYKYYTSRIKMNTYDFDYDKLEEIMRSFNKSDSEIRAEKLQKDRQAKIKEIFG